MPIRQVGYHRDVQVENAHSAFDFGAILVKTIRNADLRILGNNRYGNHAHKWDTLFTWYTLDC